MSGTRILLVSGEYPPQPGGIGDYTRLLREALVSAGAHVEVLSSRGTDAEHLVSGWTLRHLPALHMLRKIAPDVVHIQYQAGAFALSPMVLSLPWLLRRIGIPCVITFHDLRVPYMFPKAGRLRRFAIARAARAASAVVVTNAADARALRRDWLPVETIPIGANLPVPGVGAAPPADATPVVGFFGFPSRSKGVLMLIEALGLLPEPRPILRLIGAAGVPSAHNDIVSVADLDAHAGRFGVSLERTGELAAQAASDALAAVDVLALPTAGGVSLRSGSLLAALQSGRPVVATAPRRRIDLGGLNLLPHLALLDDASPATLAVGIAEALAHPRGAQTTPCGLPTPFTWPSIAAAHQRLYSSLLEPRA